MQFISERVNLLSDQAERWARHHADVRGCWETEDLAEDAVRLWASVKRDVERDPIDPAGEDAETRTRRCGELYAKLNEAMTVIERIGLQDVAKGYVLQGWDAFTRARREVTEASSVPWESVLRGIREARAGNVRPMGEIRRELERRLHA